MEVGRIVLCYGKQLGWLGDCIGAVEMCQCCKQSYCAVHGRFEFSKKNKMLVCQACREEMANIDELRKKGMIRVNPIGTKTKI